MSKKQGKFLSVESIEDLSPKREKRLPVCHWRTRSLLVSFVVLRSGAVKGAVNQQQQLQCTAEAFLQFAFHPGQRTLPAGILPEHDPQRKGGQTAFLRGVGNRTGGFGHGLLAGTELPILEKGLGELQILQQGIHFSDEFHSAAEGNVRIQERIKDPSGQNPVVVAVDTDERSFEQFFTHN